MVGNHHRRDGKAHSDDGVGWSGNKKKKGKSLFFFVLYIAYVFYVIHSRIWTDHRVKLHVTYFVYVCVIAIVNIIT